MRRLLAIVGSEHTLECPYELGTASDHINPYHHIWFNTDESNDAILGEFSRTLTVNISEMSPDVTTYTCALRMRECSRCRTEVNYPPLNTPQFKITKVAGKLIFFNIKHVYHGCQIKIKKMSSLIRADKAMIFRSPVRPILAKEKILRFKSSVLTV